MNHETLLAVFRQHNEDYGKQVGKLKSPRSYWKYCTMYKHLSEFVEKRYKVSDIAFKELTPAFITGLRVVPAGRKESLQQHGLVLYDAVPENNLYGRQ